MPDVVLSYDGVVLGSESLDDVVDGVETSKPMRPGCIDDVLGLQPWPGEWGRTGWCRRWAPFLRQLPSSVCLLYLLRPAERFRCFRVCRLRPFRTPRTNLRLDQPCSLDMLQRDRPRQLRARWVQPLQRQGVSRAAPTPASSNSSTPGRDTAAWRRGC